MDELGRNQFKEVNQPINIYVCLTKIIKPLMIVLPIITMICNLSTICLICNNKKETYLKCINQTNPTNYATVRYIDFLMGIFMSIYGQFLNQY